MSKKVLHFVSLGLTLANEKYAGNAILNKTYVVDGLSKKVKRNDGKAQLMYFVENNHPAIIDPAIFGRT